MPLARSREGIQLWVGSAPVQPVLVLAGTEDERTFHLRVLSAIAQVVHNPDFEGSWLEAENPEELRRLVPSAEPRRF